MPTTTRRGSAEAFAGFIIAMLLLAVLTCVSSCSVIDAGTVGVQRTFGTIDDKPITEGMNMLNPLSTVTKFDVKQKAHTEDDVPITTQDQLVTTMDVTINYRLVGSMAPTMLRETGSERAVLDVHLVPSLRSALREVAKSVKRAEDFYQDGVQNTIEAAIYDGLAKPLATKGIEVQQVLVRDLRLPAVIATAVQQKKEREQAAVRQESELVRYKVEQEQKVALAKAERAAAEEEAAKTRVLADAEAYRIEVVNKATAGNPAYVQLQALEALRAIAKDPATKLYFLNGDSPSPLPLMHLGDPTAAAK